MVKSMTGFGKAEAAVEGRKITVETRSLNGKQLDLSVKLPSRYRQVEYEIRNRAAKVLQRGKVDMFINCDTASSTPSATVNEGLFASYVDEFRRLASERFGSDSSEVHAAIVTSVLRLPDVVASDSDSIDQTETDALLSAVDEALRLHDAFREQEGQILINDLLRRVDLIMSYKEQIAPYEKARTETIRQRIVEQFTQTGIQYDANRLEQEMIYYLEKLDITEEKVRLDKHCDYFRAVAAEEENVGRKLGFVAQEMGREINTMGSKANDSEMQILVVKMKDELEKIKEQVLNIL